MEPGIGAAVVHIATLSQAQETYVGAVGLILNAAYLTGSGPRGTFPRPLGDCCPLSRVRVLV